MTKFPALVDLITSFHSDDSFVVRTLETIEMTYHSPYKMYYNKKEYWGLIDRLIHSERD